MSTPHVPPQPDQDPHTGQPASGSGPQPYGAPPQYGPPTQFPASGPYGPGPYGMPAPRPPRNRRLLWIILGVAGAVLVLIIVGAVVLFTVVGSATNRARAVSDDFTRLIVNGQSEQAYEQYMHPSLARNLTKEEFVRGVEGLELDSTCKPHYDSVNVSSANGTNTADVVGTLQCQGKTLELSYSFEGSDLKLDAIRLRPEG